MTDKIIEGVKLEKGEEGIKQRESGPTFGTADTEHCLFLRSHLSHSTEALQYLGPFYTERESGSESVLCVSVLICFRHCAACL